jgi:predicted dinucleotide-binding enzyme
VTRSDLIGGAPVVKAGNTLAAEWLGSNPHERGGQRVDPCLGDALDAKSEVISLFEDAGFFTIDLGDLISGGAMQQIRAPLAGINLIHIDPTNESDH